jgi:hypothetical protein
MMALHHRANLILSMPLLPQGVLPKRKTSSGDARLTFSFAEAMQRSDAKMQPWIPNAFAHEFL